MMDIHEYLDRHGYEGEWLEDRGRFTRVTAEEPDGSVWYCSQCESVEGVCPYEDRCDSCDEEDEPCDGFY